MGEFQDIFCLWTFMTLLLIQECWGFSSHIPYQISIIPSSSAWSSFGTYQLAMPAMKQASTSPFIFSWIQQIGYLRLCRNFFRWFRPIAFCLRFAEEFGVRQFDILFDYQVFDKFARVKLSNTTITPTFVHDCSSSAEFAGFPNLSVFSPINQLTSDFLSSLLSF